MEKYEGLYLVEYEVDYSTQLPTIWLFQRLKNGEKKVYQVKNFKPYFYVSEDCILGDDREIYTSIFGERVKKLTLNSPKEIYRLRQHIEEKGWKHYEADILYNNRFLIDEVEEIITVNYKKFYIDIETLSEGGFPDVNKAQQPIICLTIYNNFKKKYISWFWRKDFKQEINDELRLFSNEVDMLKDLVNYLQFESPDIILGWNVMFFDMKYLLNRMSLLNINYKVISPMKTAFVSKERIEVIKDREYDNQIPIIKGVVIFDLFKYYKKVHKGELLSYSLNNVAKEELGLEKSGEHYTIDEDYINNWKRLLEYNKRDVELCVKIDEKTGVFDFFNEMRTISHVNIDDCKYYGRVVDMFVLRHAKQNNIILPSKKPYNPNRVLEGGYVMEPIIGLHKNVIVIDLNSLYPNLINTFNLSAETRVDDGEINVNNIKFTKKIKGLIPSVLSDLGQLRIDYKKKMKELRYTDSDFKIYDMKQQAAKNLASTVYGMQALSTFRLNTDYVAQTITYLGRELIKWVKQRVKDYGYETIAQDTDSCFIKLPDELDTNMCIKKGEEIATHINSNLDLFVKEFGVTTHTLKLDFEKLYTSFLLLAKKHYAGWVVWKDGKIDNAVQLVGVAAKRSDSSKISRDLQKNVIDMILKNKTKNEIMQYVNNIIKDIKSRPLSDIAIPVKFEKGLDEYETNIPRIRGAKWANKNLNVNYGGGNKVLLLYTLGEVDCICFDDDYQLKNKDIKVDFSKMIDKSVIMKIQKIFEILKWEDELEQLITVNIKGNMLLEEFC